MDGNQFLLFTLRAFLKNSEDMIFIKDKDLTYVSASRTFALVAGLGEDGDVAGKTDYDFFEPELAAKYTEDDRSIIVSGVSSVNYIEPLPDKNGKKNYGSTSKYPILDDAGQVVGLYGISRDVTAQMELEVERETSLLSRQMFDSVFEADITENKMLRIEGWKWGGNLNICEGMPFSQAVENLTRSYVHEDFKEEFLGSYDRNLLEENYRNGIQEFSYVSMLRMPCGDCRWIEFKSRIYHSRVSNTMRITTFLKDVDDEVRYTQGLQKKAITDALTGLLNRESILESIAASLAQGDADVLNALLFIDLDCFKQVNDIWGHQFGDKVLQKTAERLRLLWGGQELCGRIGGDEFVVYLRNISSPRAAEERAAEVVKALSFCDGQAHITCSVGVALCKNGETTVERLYAQADKAMYRAKEHGRNQMAFYVEEIGA